MKAKKKIKIRDSNMPPLDTKIPVFPFSFLVREGCHVKHFCVVG